MNKIAARFALATLVLISLAGSSFAQKLPDLGELLRNLQRSVKNPAKPASAPPSSGTATSGDASSANERDSDGQSTAGAATRDPVRSPSRIGAADPALAPAATKLADSGPPLPSNVSGEPGTFKSFPSAKSANLMEHTGERFDLELDCLKSKSGPCGRYNLQARKCWGYYNGEWRADGSLLVKESQPRSGGDCNRQKCQIVVDPGLGTYRRECGNKQIVVSRGRFDAANNAELLGDKIDKSQFFRDANSDAWTAALPAVKHTLEDDSPQYKAAFAAIPDALKNTAAAGAPYRVGDDQLRDWVDAVIAIDAKGWKYDTYIPGSVRDVQATRSGATTSVHAKLTYADFYYSHAWREGTVDMELSDGKVGCIKYWNNTECSVSYATLTHPNADRTMRAADAACVKREVVTKHEAVDGACIVFDKRTGGCIQSETKDSATQYAQLANSCSRPVTFVLACMLIRQRTTIDAHGVLPLAPIFSDCQMERVPE